MFAGTFWKTRGEKCHRRTKCFNSDRETVPVPRSGKALSPEADVPVFLDVVMAYMLSPIQKDPCHSGMLAQVIVTLLVSGAQGLPGTFLAAGKHSKAAILETQGSWLQDLPGRPW